MIWITGDKHGQIEFFSKNPKFKKLNKNDILIVCGDFGFLWDESKSEKRNLKWLARQKYNIAFVEGCFDNDEIISKYKTTFWNGGIAQLIDRNIIHLMQGQIYEIENKKIFTFGGGIDELILEKNYSKTNKLQNYDLLAKAKKSIATLNENDNLDFIITHEAPTSIAASLLKENLLGITPINNVLEKIKNNISFKKWFFGKYHINKKIALKYYALFDKLIKIT